MFAYSKFAAVATATVLTATVANAEGAADRTGWPESFTVGTGS